MIDLTQLVLLLVIVILTVLLVVVGVEVFFLLRDLRKTLGKIEKVFVDFGEIGDKLKNSLESLSEIKLNLKGLTKIISLFLRKRRKEEENE